MISGVVDSTVIIHYLRRVTGAREWVDANHHQLAVTPITWMEVIYGAPGKTGQATAKAILSQFEMEYLTPTDMDRAMEQMEHYRLSHGATINDCLIASVAHRLQVPLYTHNLKDMLVLLDAALVIRPY